MVFPMGITVLYFAAARDHAGISEERFEVAAGATVAGLRAQIEERHAALAGKLGQVRFARNERFVPETEALADGDTVAVIPPVAGG